MLTEHRCPLCNHIAIVKDGILLAHEGDDRTTICEHSDLPLRSMRELIQENSKLRAGLGKLQEQLASPELARPILQRFAAGNTSIHERVLVELIETTRKICGLVPIWDENE